MQKQRGGILKFLILCICLFVFPFKAASQRNITEDDVKTTDFKPGNFGFNAVNIRQGRFLYGDSVQYRNESLFDHMSFGALWRYDKILGRGIDNYRPGSNYGLYIGKELSKNHALRLQLHAGSYYTPNPAIRLNKYQAELLYSFNWTRFFGGYNPYRNVEAVTNLGLGGFLSNRLDNHEYGPLFLFGAGLRFKLTPLFALNVDPFVALTGDGIDHSGAYNFHGYDVLYGTDFSLSYLFDNELSKEQLDKIEHRTFLDFAIGSQFDLKANIPFLQTSDPKLRLGMTRRYNSGLAIRLAANLSSSSWLNNQEGLYDIHQKNVFMGGSLDFMLSPYRMFTGRNDNRFDISALAGWEYGLMYKTGYRNNQLMSPLYDAFSLGLQLRYIYDDYTAFYLEPRFSFANYDISHEAPYEIYVDHINDNLFSVTAGMEYSTNEYRFLNKKEQPATFAPHLSMSLMGGQNFLYLAKEFVDVNHFDFSAGVAGEMQLTPYSAARLMADYSRLTHRGVYKMTQHHDVLGEDVSSYGLATAKYGYLNLSADYLFNISTLLQGYTYDRKFDIALAMGPVMTIRLNEQGDMNEAEGLLDFEGDDKVASTPQIDYSSVANHAFGFQVGIPVAYRLNSNLDFFFEPRARFYASDFIDNYRVGGLTKILNTQVGVKYAFNDRFNRPEHADSVKKPGKFFVDLGLGSQFQQTLSDMGPRVNAGLGYWFSPGVAVRASLGMNAHNWHAAQQSLHLSGGDNEYANVYQRNMSAYGRFDLMLSPHGYLKNRYDNLFDLNILAGWEYGMAIRGHEHTVATLEGHNAVSAGLQLRYNYDDFHALYLEPRYSYNLSTEYSLLSLTAGMELGVNDYAFLSKSRQPGMFTPSWSLSLLGGVGYSYARSAYEGAPLSIWNRGIAAEYRFSPYSGVRFTADNSNHARRELYSSKDEQGNTIDWVNDYRLGYWNLGFDYVFDLTTLLQGYTTDRKFDVSLAMGPVYSARVRSSEPAVEQGYAPSYVDGSKAGAWGAQISIPVSYRLNDSWALSLEPRGIAFKPNYIAHTANHYPFMQLNTQMGVKYTFNQEAPSMDEDAEGAEESRIFGDANVGLQMAQPGLGVGPQAGVGLGYRINPAFAARFSLNFGAHNWLTYPSLYADVYKKSIASSLRADLLFNPLNYFAGSAYRVFDLNLLAGWEHGVSTLAHDGFVTLNEAEGFSGGVQLRYNQSNDYTFYLEPRYTYFLKNNYTEGLFSLAAGMEFAGTEYRFRTKANQPETFSPSFSLLALGGVDGHIKPHVYGKESSFNLTVGVAGEYRFSPYSSVRLMFDHTAVSGSDIFGSRLAPYKLNYLNVGAEYQFDFTTLLQGYTPDRKWTVGLGLGPVYSYHTSFDNSGDYVFFSTPKHSLGAQLALPVTYAIDEQWGVSFEPRARMFAGDYIATDRAGRYPSLLMNSQLGVKYTIDGDRDTRVEDAADSRDFMSFAMGAQFSPYSDIAFASTAAPQIGLGFGRWINPVFGVRAMAGIGANQHDTFNYKSSGFTYNQLLSSARFSGKIDLLFNPFAMFGIGENARFAANLVAGTEAGVKLDVIGSRYVDYASYSALGAGMQFRYMTDENHALYIEPRYTLGEQVFSVTGGLEYSMNEYRFLSRKNQPEKFSPYFALSFYGGADYLYRTRTYEGTNQLGLLLGVAGEYRFTPYSGARLSADYFSLSYPYLSKGALVQPTLGYANIAADYVFDLGTLLAGYTKSRRMDVALALGPVLSTRVMGNEDFMGSGKTALGAQVGIPVQWDLNEFWGLMLEPRARFFGKDYLSGWASSGSNMSKLLDVKVGLKYSFKDYDPVRMADENHFDGKLFMDANLGVQMQESPSYSGSRYALGLGYRFTPGWTARASVNFSSHDWLNYAYRGETVYKKDVAAAFRADVLFNPLNAFAGEDNRMFDFNVLAGWEIGESLLGHETGMPATLNAFTGISGGLQLRYNVDSEHSLYVEPRYTYRMGEFTGSLYSLTAGVEFMASKTRFNHKITKINEFKPSFSLAYLGGVDNMIDFFEYGSSAPADFTTALVGEYRFSRYSGARMMFNHGTISGREVCKNTRKVGDFSSSYLSAAVEYLFDVSTLVQGYSLDRKWTIGLGMGPVYSTYLAADNSYRKSYNPVKRNAWGVQLSVPVTYAIDNQWGVSLEPRGRMFAPDYIAKHVAGRFPALFTSTQLGVKYTFGNRQRNVAEEEKSGYDFINLGMGLQYAAGTNMAFGKTGDVLLGAGLGRWFNSSVGLRLSGELGAYNYDMVSYSKVDTPYDIAYKSVSLGGRMDVLFNPFALDDTNYYSRFAVNLIAGIETGINLNVMRDMVDVDKNTYSDMVAGAQFRYHTDEHHSLYVEPRYAFGEQLFSVTAGMEFALSEHRFLSKRNQPEEFKPYKALALHGGLNYLFQARTIGDKALFDLSAGISGEYHFSPYSGARLSAEYAKLSNTTVSNRLPMEYEFGYVNVSADYMFDLSTLLAGYTSSRRLDVALAMGPVFSTRISDTNTLMAAQLKKSALGAQVSIPVQMKLTENLGISLEPRARFFGKNYAAQGVVIAGELTKMLDAQLGIKYTF